MELQGIKIILFQYSPLIKLHKLQIIKQITKIAPLKMELTNLTIQLFPIPNKTNNKTAVNNNKTKIQVKTIAHKINLQTNLKITTALKTVIKIQTAKMEATV